MSGTFDPAAEFLLDLQWPNLFERASAEPSSTTYRCKGCGLLLPRSGRKSHFTYEVRARGRRQAAHRKEMQRAAASRLRSARLARG